MGLVRAPSWSERRFQSGLASALPSVGGSVSLWYDDGWASHYEVAHRAHVRYLLPGTLAIVANYIGGAGYLSLAQLQEMAASGLWAVASHSQSHADLTTLTEEQVRAELEGALQALRNWGIEWPVFFVPPGHAHNQTVRKLAYLLHPHMRIGGMPLPPRSSAWILRGSFEVSENTLASYGGSVESLLDEIERQVALGCHVPLMFHAIYEGATSVNITPDHYAAFIRGLVERAIPVVRPEHVCRPHNLVADGSFEWGYWYRTYNNGTADYDTTAGYQRIGSQSLRLTWDGVGTAPYAAHRLHIPQEGGRTYRVTWWARGDGDLYSRTRIRLRQHTEYGLITEQTADHDATALTTAFQRFTATYVPIDPLAVAAEVRVEMYVTGGAGVRSVWVDGLSIHPDDLPEYNVA